MKTIPADSFSSAAVVEELLDGSGAVLLPQLFTKDQVQEARDLILQETADRKVTGSHFNQDDEDAMLQRRVWNLIAKGDVFVDMLLHPQIMSSMQAFLGSEFVVGSICASRTMPGFGGQEPHIDYPYWDYYREATFPTRISSAFPLNAQAVFLIDPFTEENGATAYVPGSQRTLHYPEVADAFFDKCARMTGQPGDVVLFYGAAWHCAMPNRSDGGRIGIIVEFLPKFVKPVEDLLSDLDQEFLDRASPELRQLLGLSYPWPSTPPHPPFPKDEAA